MPIPFEAFAGSGGLIPSLNELVAAFVNKRTSQAKGRRDDRKSELARRLADKQNELYAARTRAEAAAREAQREQKAAQDAANYELKKNAQAFEQASNARKSELDWQRADSEGVTAVMEDVGKQLELMESDDPGYAGMLKRFNGLVEQRAVANGVALASDADASATEEQLSRMKQAFSSAADPEARERTMRTLEALVSNTNIPANERVHMAVELRRLRAAGTKAAGQTQTEAPQTQVWGPPPQTEAPQTQVWGPPPQAGAPSTTGVSPFGTPIYRGAEETHPYLYWHQAMQDGFNH